MFASKKTKPLIIISLLLLCNTFLSAQTSSFPYVFKNKKEGYNVYRIPAIIKTKSGKLLAFCEGRKNLFDGGNIDMVMKSSDDKGLTWSQLKVIWNDGENTCGNPSPVVDKVTGNIILLGTLNNDKVFVLTSKDEGETWDTPRDITKEVKPENWQWYATGPVHAIQLQNTSYQNRIIVPCNHTVKGTGKHTSHIIYSDDKGISWKTGGSVADDKTDECTLSELSDGHLLLNMRNNDKSTPNRKISYSNDGGLSWSPVTFDSTLIEPVCQGALLRYSLNPDIILFVNPHHKKQRKQLTLFISYDEGKTWKDKTVIYKSKAAYNDIVVLENGDVVCVFETGKVLPYSGIVFKIIASSVIQKQ